MPLDVPDAGDACPTSRPAWRPYKDRMGEMVRPAAPHRPAPRRPAIRSAARATRRFGQQVWMRADGTLPDDPTLHACIVTYASDMTLLDTTVLPFGMSWETPGMQMASLDHAMWFHRPFRADDWLLYDQHPISTGGARGLAGGDIYTADGHLAISVVQEGLVRVAQS